MIVCLIMFLLCAIFIDTVSLHVDVPIFEEPCVVNSNANAPEVTESGDPKLNVAKFDVGSFYL